MKRKVINISGNTMMVSLPHKWVENMRIKKGDEIEIKEKDRSLMLSTDIALDQKSIEFDASEYHASLPRVIGAFYKKGYDEVRIRVKSPDQIELMAKAARDELVGYELLEQKGSYCIFKDVSQMEDTELKSMINRTFFILDEFISRIISSMNLGLSDIDAVMLTDLSVNRFYKLCRRLVIKYGYGSQINTPFIYYIVELIEKFGDGLKSVCEHLKEAKLNAEPKIIDYLKQTKSQLMLARELLFDYSSIRFEKFYVTQKDLIKSITDEPVSKTGSKSKLFSELRILNQLLLEMHGAIIGIYI